MHATAVQVVAGFDKDTATLCAAICIVPMFMLTHPTTAYMIHFQSLACPPL